MLKASGYDDGYYWDMNAVVEIDGQEYTIQDAGSGSGYIPIYQSMSKNGPCKLTGVELETMDLDEDDDNDWDYILHTIEEIAHSFFSNNAKESYEHYEDTYDDYSTHVDGVKISSSDGRQMDY